MPSVTPPAEQHQVTHHHADGHATTAPAKGHHHHPAVAGVTCLDVYATPDGETLHLLVGRRATAEEPAGLHYQQSTDGGATWTGAVRVDAGLPPANRVHPGMDARIAAAGDTVMAFWSTEGTGFMGSGPMVLVRSTDAGRTWTRGPNPADDGSTAGHDFIDVAADADGAFHLVWLDGRNGRQGLRYARSEDGGVTWCKNVTLDDETCECCWNALTTAGGQVAVLYRDKGPRDMKLVRSADGGKTWEKPIVAGDFNWQLEGCPHTGGGVGLDPTGAVHMAVWTGTGERTGVYYIGSKHNGSAELPPPLRLGGLRTNHPDLAVTAGGAVTMVWDEYADGEQTVKAVTRSDGRWSEPRTLSTAGASATHPRLVTTKTGARAFWIEQGEAQPRTWSSARIGVNTTTPGESAQ